MSVTFRDYGDHSAGTVPGSSDPLPPNQLVVSRFSPTEIDFTVQTNSTTYTLAFIGQFDTGSVNFTPLTMADLQGLGVAAKISSFVVSQAGTYAISEVFNPAIDFFEFSAFSDTTLDGLTNVLSGNDVYYTTSDAPYDHGSNAYFLYGGNDVLYENHKLLQYDDVFYGGDGIDKAVMLGKLANFKIAASNSVWNELTRVADLKGYQVTDSTRATNDLQLNQVERLQFSDTMVGLDVGKGEHTGEVYRLYLTVLGRNPESDPVGCGFWIDKLDRGILNVEQMVGNFLNSTEFVTRFGGTTNTNESFVNLMYLNLLGRDGHPDSGFAFWLNVLNNHQASREQVVAGFMESPENISNAAPLIGDTPTYQQWVS